MRKNTYIQMTRQENEGPRQLWDMLDRAASIAKIPLSSEVLFGVKDFFDISYEPNIGSYIKTQLPLIVPLMLSDRQLECYITHNYFLHILKAKHSTWQQNTSVANECIKAADKATSLHFSSEFLMGTIIKASILEWLWMIVVNSEDGRQQMAFKSEAMLREFKKKHYPRNEKTYFSVLNLRGEIQIDGIKRLNFKERLEALDVSPKKCFQLSIQEPTGSILNLSIEGIRSLVESAITTQARIDHMNLGKQIRSIVLAPDFTHSQTHKKRAA